MEINIIQSDFSKVFNDNEDTRSKENPSEIRPIGLPSDDGTYPEDCYLPSELKQKQKKKKEQKVDYHDISDSQWEYLALPGPSKPKRKSKIPTATETGFGPSLYDKEIQKQYEDDIISETKQTVSEVRFNGPSKAQRNAQVIQKMSIDKEAERLQQRTKNYTKISSGVFDKQTKKVVEQSGLFEEEVDQEHASNVRKLNEYKRRYQNRKVFEEFPWRKTNYTYSNISKNDGIALLKEIVSIARTEFAEPFIEQRIVDLAGVIKTRYSLLLKDPVSLRDYAQNVSLAIDSGLMASEVEEIAVEHADWFNQGPITRLIMKLIQIAAETKKGIPTPINVRSSVSSDGL